VGGSEISLYNMCGYYASDVLLCVLLSLGQLRLSLVWRCVMLPARVYCLVSCIVMRWLIDLGSRFLHAT
jgi:hypothetical protein